MVAVTDKKLAILIEGESLLNDGAALVFFTIFLQLARGEYSKGNGMQLYNPDRDFIPANYLTIQSIS